MPFAKGQSGNPGGKRKDKLFHEALVMQLKEIEDSDKRGLRRIASQLIKKAEDGDIQAIKEVADRLDGKPAQALQHGGEDGGNIIIRMVTDDEQL